MRTWALIVLCSLLAACGEDEAPPIVTPPGLAFVDAYEAAYGDDDADAFFALHTKASQKYLVTEGMPEGRQRTVGGWFMGFRKGLDPEAPSPLGGPYASERRDGDKLICVIRKAGGTEERELTLVQEDGAWRFDLLDTYIPDR